MTSPFHGGVAAAFPPLKILLLHCSIIFSKTGATFEFLQTTHLQILPSESFRCSFLHLFWKRLSSVTNELNKGNIKSYCAKKRKTMGSSCSSSSSTKTAFRFKNFVVAVYPTDHDGELNKDALGKLISYVANNVERIPRVCRKISKLVAADLKRGDIKRVSIGMQILRHLLDEATELDAYCPYVTSLCLTLFERGVVEHRISAADVLTALCHRIVERSDERSGGEGSGAAAASIPVSSAPIHPNFMTSMSKNSMEHARRLVSDAKDRFSTYLRDMLVEGVATNDIISLHCRYAATVALGNLAYCIQGSLPATSLVDLIPPVLSNLHHLLREAAASMSSRVNQRRRQRKENISAMSDDPAANDFRAPNTVILPVEAGEKDAAFYKASVAW
ncbi:Hypothetical protein, putative [Bodo saltans]|uniref:Uncharacterized protein n=1 Tax=Bodo saltans TaxID=75058 RepID=A0A0S4JA72_BODSA|nr:Hypothetical protein, putative [Bodo saltans]|eukprot:CUG87003.1 Hypothetical protein, putative [Bodo saltans]